MKKNLRFLNGIILAVFIGSFLTACDSDSDSDSVKTITFEDVTLGDNGYWNGSDLSGTASSYQSWGVTVTEYTGSFQSGILTCENLYNATWLSWSGMACSNQTNMDSIGYGNQYSVYAQSGASGSAKFALICSDSATCTFDEPVTVKSLMYNNSTYAYWALKEGEDGSGYVTKFAAGDSFYVAVTGYSAAGVETASTKIYLADFRNSKTYICSDWTKASLESLGQVSKLVFTFSSSDESVYGMNTPAYVCIDNIVYRKD
jgi:hypothetical protein